MAAVPAVCPACRAEVLRVLAAGTDGPERRAVLVDPDPGGIRPRYDVEAERYVPRHQRAGWPRDLHTRHSWTCERGGTE